MQVLHNFFSLPYPEHTELYEQIEVSREVLKRFLYLYFKSSSIHEKLGACSVSLQKLLS